MRCNADGYKSSTSATSGYIGLHRAAICALHWATSSCSMCTTSDYIRLHRATSGDSYLWSTCSTSGYIELPPRLQFVARPSTLLLLPSPLLWSFANTIFIHFPIHVIFSEARALFFSKWVHRSGGCPTSALKLRQHDRDFPGLENPHIWSGPLFILLVRLGHGYATIMTTIKTCLWHFHWSLTPWAGVTSARGRVLALA